MWRNQEKIHYATSNGWRTILHDLQHQKRKKVFNQTFDFSWSVIFFGFPHVCGEVEASNCDLRVLRKLQIIRLQLCLVCIMIFVPPEKKILKKNFRNFFEFFCRTSLKLFETEFSISWIEESFIRT